MRVGAQERGRRDQHAGRAEAALDASVVEERPLQRAELAAVRKPLDRGDLATLCLQRQIGARVHRLPVEQHHAGAALGVVTALFRSREPDHVAHRLEKARSRVELDRVGRAVDRKDGRDFHVNPPCSAGLAGTGTTSPHARRTAASIARRVITAAMARR